MLLYTHTGTSKQKLHTFAKKGLDPQAIIHSNGTNYLYVPDLSERSADGSYVPVYLITKIGGKVYAYVPESPLVVANVNTIYDIKSFNRKMKDDVNRHLEALHLKDGYAALSYLKKNLLVNQRQRKIFLEQVQSISYPPVAVFKHGVEGIDGQPITGEYLFPVSPTNGAFALYQKGVSPVPFGRGQVRIYHFSSDSPCLSSFFTGPLAKQLYFRLSSEGR